MAFRVETSLEAENDALAILEWLISKEVGEAGVRWFVALEEAIASLATFPDRCPLAPENSKHPFEVRHLLYGRRPHVYRILFTVQGDTVNILHIRHGRRTRLPELN
jgi:plasmid stabilization system protein ParE